MRCAEDPVAELLQSARSGDRDARERLAAYAERRVAAFVSRRMGASDRRWVESQDVVQQCVLEVLGRLGTLPPDAGEKQLVARLIRTAESRILDLHRKYRREIGASILSTGFDPAGSVESTGPVTRADEVRFIESVLDELPEKYSAIVRARIIDGESFVHIGKRLRIPPDTARRRFDRIVDRVALRLSTLREGRR